ncbi:hypothetical protein B0G77_6859 [Paraburkholderia sp. BL10I2N1]|nr:hypothetical protein B0G77_6859 [Paraburkholderia sp. BL10I2N1]
MMPCVPSGRRNGVQGISTPHFVHLAKLCGDFGRHVEEAERALALYKRQRLHVDEVKAVLAVHVPHRGAVGGVDARVYSRDSHDAAALQLSERGQFYGRAATRPQRIFGSPVLCARHSLGRVNQHAPAKLCRPRAVFDVLVPIDDQAYAAACMAVHPSTISRTLEDLPKWAHLLAAFGLQLAPIDSMVVDQTELSALESMSEKYLQMRRQQRLKGA